MDVGLVEIESTGDDVCTVQEFEVVSCQESFVVFG